MSENGQGQSKQLLLPAFAILLVVIILITGIQTWYLIGVKKQLDAITNQQDSAAEQPQDTTVKSGAIIDMNNTTTSPYSQQFTPPQKQDTQQRSPQNRKMKPAYPPPGYYDDFYNSPYDARTWNPYEEIERMQRDMDRMFNNTFNNFNNSPDFQHLFRHSISKPEMDFKEDDSQYTVIVNLPGADEKNISVNLNGQILTIEGDQSHEKHNRNTQGDTIFRERRSGKFHRSIRLAEPIVESGMKTHVDNGVLTIIIPKKKLY